MSSPTKKQLNAIHWIKLKLGIDFVGKSKEEAFSFIKTYSEASKNVDFKKRYNSRTSHSGCYNPKEKWHRNKIAINKSYLEDSDLSTQARMNIERSMKDSKNYLNNRKMGFYSGE